MPPPEPPPDCVMSRATRATSTTAPTPIHSHVRRGLRFMLGDLSMSSLLPLLDSDLLGLLLDSPVAGDGFGIGPHRRARQSPCSGFRGIWSAGSLLDGLARRVQHPPDVSEALAVDIARGLVVGEPVQGQIVVRHLLRTVISRDGSEQRRVHTLSRQEHTGLALLEGRPHPRAVVVTRRCPVRFTVPSRDSSTPSPALTRPSSAGHACAQSS